MNGWLCETLTGVQALRWGPLPLKNSGAGHGRGVFVIIT